MKLSPPARSALETVREKHLAYTIAKANIEAELKRELGIRLENIKNERDNALRYAVQAGVPKTQLGKAIGTSNYKTVQEILGPTFTEVNASIIGAEKLKIDVMSENSCQVYLTDVGDSGFTGSAFMSVSPDGELEFIDGDLAVITQIYRNNLLNNILNALGR
jgi:hypothetical protein